MSAIRDHIRDVIDPELLRQLTRAHAAAARALTIRCALARLAREQAVRAARAGEAAAYWLLHTRMPPGVTPRASAKKK